MRRLFPLLIVVFMVSGCNLEKAAQTQTLNSLGSQDNISPQAKKLLVQLKKDKSLKVIECFPSGNSMSLSENNETKSLLSWVFKLKQGNMGAKKACITPEGDAVTEYIIVENDKIKVVLDSSEDKFGARDVEVYNPTQIYRGYFEEDGKESKTFKISELQLPEGKEIFIQYELPNGEKRYF
ncbi:DUF4362 domain-containing protein [Coleofasciculus sp. FACHB-1120]|uniref:DUF4362 domain-containing protein n=1 Tax=Coleofasciculus sp. FACHB-1120 TaxID=2692783 RepID=UPI001681FC12|nr:DUF4362 domain-containing protein [Coleofasciculus sp. FACHB-1120]MBD2740801.1 DUF4362 domain-containing protein [Coleofasciculus sp. FACHB-1120]